MSRPISHYITHYITHTTLINVSIQLTVKVAHVFRWQDRKGETMGMEIITSSFWWRKELM